MAKPTSQSLAAGKRNMAIGCLARTKGGLQELLSRREFAELLTQEEKASLVTASAHMNKVFKNLSERYWKKI